jgi:membrane protein DedA with SNARE-associated domain
MSSLLAALLSYVLLYRYTAIFTIVFLAGIIVPFPASAMLLGVGAFASHGYFNFLTVALTATIANVLGDLVSFSLARRYGNRITRILHIRTQFFSLLERYIRTDAASTIFITRFAGSLGPVTNIFAGLSDVHPIKFLIFDVAGNAGEIFALVTIGYLLGDYWQSVSGIQSILSYLIIIGVVAFFLFKVYGALRRKYSVPQ